MPNKQAKPKKKKDFLAGIEEGGLHRSLGIPENQPVPTSKLEIKPGDSPRVKKQKTLAKNMRGWKK